MDPLNYFDFTAPPSAAPNATVDDSIVDKRALLCRLARDLSFPEYFGNNWDALVDCLSDATCCGAKSVTIEHASLPRLSESELAVYLLSLADAASRRAQHHLPKLRLVFRLTDRAAVVAAVRGLDP